MPWAEQPTREQKLAYDRKRYKDPRRQLYLRQWKRARASARDEARIKEMIASGEEDRGATRAL